MRKFFTIVLALFGFTTFAHAQSIPGGQGAKAPLTAEELQKRCDGGNAIACDDLGVLYLKGDGVAKDAKKANALFQRACDGGDPVGCYDLAESYRFGDGVAKDMKAAAAFYQRACDGGNAGGCSQLAIQYNGGEGVAQDDAKAALFADRSCKGGSPLGYTLLGSVYGDGAPGYPKDVKRAEELFRNACFDKADFKAAPDTVSRAACSSLAKLTGKPACTRNTYPGGPSELICFEGPGTWKVTVTPAAAPPPDPAVTSNAAVNAGNAAYAR
jgi:Sel1 repeat